MTEQVQMCEGCGHAVILHGQDGCAVDPDPKGSLRRCPCPTPAVVPAGQHETEER